MKKLFMTLCVLLFSITTFAANKLPAPKNSTQAIDQIAAIVNNGIITQSQIDTAYQRAIQQIRQQGRQMPDPSTLKTEILDQLIYQKLQLQLAKRNNIKVTNAQVNKAIASIAKGQKLSVKQLKQKVTEQGFTLSEFRQQIKKQIVLSIMQHQALEKEVQVSKAEVDHLLTQYKSQKSFGMQYHVVDILVPLPSAPTHTQEKQAKAEALTILKKLRQGTSTDNIKGAEVNDLGWRAASDLPSLFTRKLANMKPGNTAGPLRAQNGYHIIKLINAKRSAKQLPSRAQAKRLLQGQKFQKALHKWLLKLRKQSYVKIVNPQ